jgi:hypothetical protein
MDSVRRALPDARRVIESAIVNDRTGRPGAAERAAARRARTDWHVARFDSFDDAEQADIEESARTPPAERLRLVFLLSGQLIRSDIPRRDWPAGKGRLGNEAP